jgi:hypothetical protein
VRILSIVTTSRIVTSVAMTSVIVLTTPTVLMSGPQVFAACITVLLKYQEMECAMGWKILRSQKHQRTQ